MKMFLQSLATQAALRQAVAAEVEHDSQWEKSGLHLLDQDISLLECGFHYKAKIQQGAQELLPIRVVRIGLFGKRQ
jgi:hypothetical protein